MIQACLKSNIEIIKLLMDYATSHNIILNPNEKNEDGFYSLLESRDIQVNSNNDYPLLTACRKRVEIVQALIDYANKIRILLELNERNKHGYCPQVMASGYHRIEIIQTLVEYALGK
eukprot:jgi/Orpsp1_1/1177499/evm.model.c7180000061671.1